MRSWLLGQFTVVTDRLTEHAARIGRTTARYQLLGDTMAGGAALVVYGALLALVLRGHIPAAAAGTAFIAAQTCRLLLGQLVTGINSRPLPRRLVHLPHRRRTPRTAPRHTRARTRTRPPGRHLKSD
ncbi:hypothetical protein ACFYWO_01380 [Streptomyces sp. NPDC002932]|uniref:hypothetical protein n=1 Tax=Streptomyces sp. NPDC002932 TaxID=3364672 RepID=UPI00368A2082